MPAEVARCHCISARSTWLPQNRPSRGPRGKSRDFCPPSPVADPTAVSIVGIFAGSRMRKIRVFSVPLRRCMCHDRGASTRRRLASGGWEGLCKRHGIGAIDSNERRIGPACVRRRALDLPSVPLLRRPVVWHSRLLPQRIGHLHLYLARLRLTPTRHNAKI